MRGISALSKAMGLLLATVLLVTPGAAGAQDFGFEALRFHPSPSQRTGYFTLDSGRSLPGGGYELGLMGHYANDPFVANRQNERIFSIIADQWTLDLLLAWAPVDNFQLSVDVPFYLAQTTEEPGFLGRAADVLETAGVGDIRVTPKWTFLRGSYGGTTGFDMGLLAIVSIPVGDSEAFQGEDFRIEPRVAAEFLTASQWGVGLNLGFLIRPTSQSFSNIEVGNQLTYGLGVKVPLVYDMLHAIAELNGAVSVGLDDLGSEENPLEVLGGLRFNVAGVYLTGGAGTGLNDGYGSPDFRAFFGIAYSGGEEVNDRDGDGYPDDEDGCPDDPEDFDDFEDEDGCPDPDNDQDGILDVDDLCPLDPEDIDGWQDSDGCPDPDNDGDGILDVDDSCPNEPEDFDEWMDEDGCPDPDNDADGILDVVDQCPNTAEDLDGYEDEDGCPEEGPVTLRPEVIEITQQIQFDYDSANIRSESDRIIDAVAEIILSNPDIAGIRVEGHTSTEGSAAHNLDLSRRRARAVREALITRGVQASRLQAEGYGETRPLVPLDVGNPQALEANRRVEFHIQR